jgi:hypothetical protein
MYQHKELLKFKCIIVEFCTIIQKVNLIKTYIRFILIAFVFSACSFKDPHISEGATILIKTPSMKFYDKGFIKKYPNHTQVAIFSAGNLILELKIYENRICKDTFECQSLSSFNKEYLSSSYEESFIKKLFDSPQKEILFKDDKNKIVIKVLKD